MQVGKALKNIMDWEAIIIFSHECLKDLAQQASQNYCHPVCFGSTKVEFQKFYNCAKLLTLIEAQLKGENRQWTTCKRSLCYSYRFHLQVDH